MRFGIADDGQIGPAHVAGKAEPHRLAAGRVVQHDAGRAQNVARIVSSRSSGFGASVCGVWYGTGWNSGRVARRRPSCRAARRGRFRGPCDLRFSSRLFTNSASFSWIWAVSRSIQLHRSMVAGVV